MASKALPEIVFSKTYERWISQYDSLNRTARHSLEADIARLAAGPIISIIMLISDDDALAADETIRSVQRQLYRRWEFCLAVGRSVSEPLSKSLRAVAQQDGRIRTVDVKDLSTWADRANAALKLASGDFVALVDPGDALAEHALYWLAKELIANPETDLIFSDEDKIDRLANHSDPWFKPDWNPALILSCNAFGRLGIFRRSMLERVGGFRPEFEGAEEHELVLRCARVTQIDRIRHIPRVLYHRSADAGSRRAAVDDFETGRRAIVEHLALQNITAEVYHRRAGYEIVYATPVPHPRVSIVIATTGRPDLLEPCLNSLYELTSYDNWEVILLMDERVRQSAEREAYLNDIGKRLNLRVVEYSHRPFNYSWVNNLGAAQASGDILCFLNDDTKVITIDWLDQLVARVSLPNVAAAGPKLYYPNGTIQHAGVILGLGVSGVAGHACHGLPRGRHGYFGRAYLERDVSGITAACMAIRADVFRMIGGFDEAMPLAYNDVDLCLRLRAAGWRIIWTPTAELMHHGSASLGRHDIGAHAEQYASDVALMRQRWQSVLDADPFYNRNLSLEREYKLAFPPRIPVSDNLRSAAAA
jgi:GT2 family glycosyltransferase